MVDQRAIAVGSSSYLLLLDRLKAGGYEVGPMSVGLSVHPRVRLRHDVEFSMSAALALARLENSQGYVATYYFATRSPFFNLLYPRNRLVIEEIAGLGHEIGAHLGSDVFDNSDHYVDRELVLARDLIPRLSDNLVSLHSPPSLEQTRSNHASLALTYEPILAGTETYVADSQGRWNARPEELDSVNNSQVQLLTHPLWWAQLAQSATERLQYLWGHISADMIDASRAFLPKLTASATAEHEV